MAAEYVAGRCTLAPQDERNATMAPMLKKEDGRIDWAKPARAVHDHVRGMRPWPGAATALHGKLVKVHATHVVEAHTSGAPPGQVLVADKSRVLVACREHAVELAQSAARRKTRDDGRRVGDGRGVIEGDVLEAP